jgi:hypothetical protein
MVREENTASSVDGRVAQPLIRFTHTRSMRYLYRGDKG